jgi:hypothetical protein
MVRNSVAIDQFADAITCASTAVLYDNEHEVHSPRANQSTRGARRPFEPARQRSLILNRQVVAQVWLQSVPDTVFEPIADIGGKSA